jgi:aryl-alcohol dehydrogenase-like predicted oxidoreductase
MALAGRATAEGTARYAARFGTRLDLQAYRPALDLTLSAIGYGTSLGEPTDDVDSRYVATICTALEAGCNVVDTAVSYRAQRSEIALGRAVAQSVLAGTVARDELLLISKAGFIPYRLVKPVDPWQYVYDHFIRAGVAGPDDLAGGIHCMTPDFISQQIAWSLRNTDLRALDVYLIQNPEAQLSFVDRTTFRRRLQLAFARLEEEVAAGRIGCYGVSTWEGFRRAPVESGYMSLEVLMSLVTEVAGPRHHFKCVQAPINPRMLEAITLRNQPVRNSIMPFVYAVRDVGLTLIASAALGQGQIGSRLGETMRGLYSDLTTQAQRSLQFVRSLPYIATTLFGSLDPEHVRESLDVLRYPPDAERALRLAQARGR